MSSFLFVAVMFMSGAIAQNAQSETVSDEELQKYASALNKVEIIDQDAQLKMVNAVEAEGLEVERYNEIREAQMNESTEVDADSEELEMHQAATMEVVKIIREVQEEMQSKIMEAGLSLNRYQEISQLVQNDPELQAKLQELL